MSIRGAWRLFVDGAWRLFVDVAWRLFVDVGMGAAVQLGLIRLGFQGVLSQGVLSQGVLSEDGPCWSGGHHGLSVRLVIEGVSVQPAQPVRAGIDATLVL